MRIQCKTNIDCARLLEWPTELPARPMVGDLIRSRSSTHDKAFELGVVETTWYYCVHRHEWILQVELNLAGTCYPNVPVFEAHVKGRFHG